MYPMNKRIKIQKSKPLLGHFRFFLLVVQSGFFLFLWPSFFPAEGVDTTVSLLSVDDVNLLDLYFASV